MSVPSIFLVPQSLHLEGPHEACCVAHTLDRVIDLIDKRTTCDHLWQWLSTDNTVTCPRCGEREQRDA